MAEPAKESDCNKTTTVGRSISNSVAPPFYWAAWFLCNKAPEYRFWHFKEIGKTNNRIPTYSDHESDINKCIPLWYCRRHLQSAPEVLEVLWQSYKSIIW